jgi:hypothetical protein
MLASSKRGFDVANYNLKRLFRDLNEPQFHSKDPTIGFTK